MKTPIVISEGTLHKQTSSDIVKDKWKEDRCVKIVELESMQLLFHKLQKIAPTDANIQ